VDPSVSLYSPNQESYLQSIEQEAADLFPKGKMYSSVVDMREQLRQFGCRKGFGVTTVCNKLCCTRCAEPQSDINKREKKIADGLVAEGSRRIFKSSTRCGCPFQICFRRQTPKDSCNKSIVITGSSYYKHDNGCVPSRDQLQVELQKAGVLTRAVVKEKNFKPILAVLNTNQHVAAPLLRDLVRPLFPPGLLLNERSDEGQISLSSKVYQELSDATVPEYFTTSFRVFNELLAEAESKPTDIQQVITFLR
jgi:hypothetical protein